MTLELHKQSRVKLPGKGLTEQPADFNAFASQLLSEGDGVVRNLPRAKADRRNLFEYLRARSPDGALAW
ncbi:MAG: hypothetical protein AAF805_12375 [Planctomycetota bacterium]